MYTHAQLLQVEFFILYFSALYHIRSLMEPGRKSNQLILVQCNFSTNYCHLYNLHQVDFK